MNRICGVATGIFEVSFVLLTQEINDFHSWKAQFDEQLHARRGSGLIDLHILRDESDPNVVTLLFGTTNLTNARKFIESEDWRNSMTEAGAVGHPEVRFLNECRWHDSH